MAPPKSVIRVVGDTAHICAWCDTKRDGEQWADDRKLHLSHGICPTCSNKHFNIPPLDVSTN